MMAQFRQVRTRGDWLRFGAIIFGAALVVCSAVFGHHSGAVTTLEIATGALFVVLAFASISTNPRVRRLTSWGALGGRQAGPR